MAMVQVSSSQCELTQIVEDQVFTLLCDQTTSRNIELRVLVPKLLQDSAGGRVMSLIIYFK